MGLDLRRNRPVVDRHDTLADGDTVRNNTAVRLINGSDRSIMYEVLGTASPDASNDDGHDAASSHLLPRHLPGLILYTLSPSLVLYAKRAGDGWGSGCERAQTRGGRGGVVERFPVRQVLM